VLKDLAGIKFILAWQLSCHTTSAVISQIRV